MKKEKDEAAYTEEIETTEESKEDGFTDLIKQIESEFTTAQDFIRPKWETWVKRLKLYNNQKRDDKAVGDPLLFTTFQTVFASIYDDKMMQTWEGNEEGDDELAENLNNLSNYDYELMEMDTFTREFEWDALFFGRALADLSEFDREESKTTVPRVIDPLTLYRDPNAISVRGRKGRGRLRFLGYEIGMTKNEINELSDFMHKDKLVQCDTETDIQRNKQLRVSAQGFNETSPQKTLTGENQEYIFYVWFTWHKGKKVRILLSQDKKTIHRYFVLPGKEKYFPLVDCSPYPMSTNWDGVSVPDLIEDKQRHSAAVLNQALRSVKFSQNPSYLFNANKLDRNEIAKTEFGNMIPVNGTPAGEVVTLPRESVKQDVEWILNALDTRAQRATATPEIQQGVVSQTKRTLGELNLVSEGVDNRYSLAVKIFGTAFKSFWQIWYQNYKEYFADKIDEKSIRISGGSGPRFRKFSKENLISSVDPDVTIKSKVLADAEKFNDLNSFVNFHALASKSPDYNIKAGLKHIGELSGVKTDLMNVLFKQSADEIEAEAENLILESGDTEKIKSLLKMTQDHSAHNEIHNKLADSEAKTAHMEAHEKAMLMLRDNPAIKMQVENTINPMGNPLDGKSQDVAMNAMAGQSTREISGENLSDNNQLG